MNRYANIFIAGFFLSFGFLAASSFAESLNDIQMLVMRRDGKSVGNQKLDALSSAQAHAKLVAISRGLALDVQRPSDSSRKVESAMSTLRLIGPSAEVAVPALAKMLSRSGIKAYNVPAAFCPLTETIAAVGNSTKESGRALGENLLRAQRETPTSETCHTCSCALRAIASMKGAAAKEAGPFLVRFMKAKGTGLTYQTDLSKALAAVNPPGVGAAGLQRLRDKSIHPDDKVGLVSQMLPDLKKMNASDQQAFYNILLEFQGNDYFRLREVAMTGLGSWRRTALTNLTKGLSDSHYLVKRAAAKNLALLGTDAAPATATLVAGLDPILGTTSEFSAALVAIGGAKVASAIRSATPRTIPWAAYYEAVATAAETKRLHLATAALTKHFAISSGPQSSPAKGDAEGPMYIATEKKGGGLAYSPDLHRIRLKFKYSKYTGPDSPAKTEAKNGSVTIYKNPSSFWVKLAGVQAGEKLKLYLSPPLAISPYYGTNEPAGANIGGEREPAFYEVSVEEVCEPIFWTFWKGQGVFGPMIFEVRCSD